MANASELIRNTGVRCNLIKWTQMRHQLKFKPGRRAKKRRCLVGTAKFREETSKMRRAEAAPHKEYTSEKKPMQQVILRRSIIRKDGIAGVNRLKIITGQSRLMTFRVIRRVILAIIGLSVAPHGHAQMLQGAVSPCRVAIAIAESEQRIPDAFLSAIAKVESGRPIDGMVVAWPWTINAEGVGSFFASKEDAIAAVQALQARGVRSIDVGCLQVNLQQHPEAFHSLDQAFDPPTNARFAAGLLLSLFGQTGSWPLAAAAYHSQTPTIGAAYQRQVLTAWAEPDRPGGAGGKAVHVAGPAREGVAAHGGMAPVAAAPVLLGSFGRQGRFLTAEQPRPGVTRSSGRSLADYRMMPTQLAFKMPAHAG